MRERVLRDLAVRRKKARQQVEKLNAGRERLLEAYDVVRRTIDEATDELSTSLVRRAPRRRRRRPAHRRRARPHHRGARRGGQAAAGLIDLPLPDVDETGRGRRGTGTVLGRGPGGGRRTPSPPPEAEAPAADRRSRRPSPRSAAAARAAVARRPSRGSRRPPSPRWSRPPRARGSASSPTPGAGARPDDEPEPAGRAGRRRAPEALPRPPRPSAPPWTTCSPGCGPSRRPDRRRAEADGAEDADDAGPDADRGRAPSRTEPEPAEPTAFTERDDALVPIDKELARRLKRALADEQNEVLDRLRRVKPKGVDDVLPEPDDARRPLVRGGVARARSTPPPPAPPGPAATPGSIADLADELAQSLTAPLRERIDRSFVASDGNLDDVADRVRALYREWKGQRLADTSRHYVAAAYARGVVRRPARRAPRSAGSSIPLGGPCPDCDDNVLGGRADQGERVPHRPPVRPRAPRLPVPGGRGGRLTDHH